MVLQQLPHRMVMCCSWFYVMSRQSRFSEEVICKNFLSDKESSSYQDGWSINENFAQYEKIDALANEYHPRSIFLFLKFFFSNEARIWSGFGVASLEAIVNPQEPMIISFSLLTCTNLIILKTECVLKNLHHKRAAQVVQLGKANRKVFLSRFSHCDMCKLFFRIRKWRRRMYIVNANVDTVQALCNSCIAWNQIPYMMGVSNLDVSSFNQAYPR